MGPLNPFDGAAAIGAARRALAEIDAETRALAAGAHVTACEIIMKHAVLARVQLARDAAMKWDEKVEVRGVFQTQTVTGVLHLRVKMESGAGTPAFAVIEFIGSPKSNVIACEGRKGYRKHTWPRIAMTAEGISRQIDKVLAEFLIW
ncbi:MAG: hypothetical protein QM627_11755 [Luteolibacter sp.]